MSKIPGFRSGKLWKKVVASIGYFFILMIIITIARGGGNSTPTAPASAPAKQDSSQAKAATNSTTSTSSTPAPAPAPAPTPSVKTYQAGMYKVGSDIPAGEYVLIADGQAYFQIAKDSTGTLDSILANDNFTNRSIVTVKEGQYLTINSCTAYASKDAPKVTPDNGYLPEGMYKVGIDLPAGEYKVSADGQGYVEVSNNSLHDLESIVSNDNFQGDKYITIKNGQYLKLSGTKLKLN